MRFEIGGLLGEGIEPAEEGDEGGIPVDGDFVRGIGFIVVNVGLIRIVGRIDGIVHITLILLTWIGTSDEHAWEGSLNGVGF